MEKNITRKIFENPQKYRDMLISKNLIYGDRNDFSGKSFVCVSLTRFCPVGCSFCFFKSGPAFRKSSREDSITKEGIEKFIEFSNTINLGYLLVSGGGEPMLEKHSVLKIIEKVESERIVFVTSANWAKKKSTAEIYLENIKKSMANRKSKSSITIRVSVDSEHTSSIGLDPIINLIELFHDNHHLMPNLSLQIHSIENDPSIDEILKLLKDKYIISRKFVNEKRISDGINAIKIVPKQEIINFGNLKIKVGYAKVFYSDIKVNLKSQESLKKNIEVYQKDLFESEDGNSSIVTNKLGNPGLDFWVNYNGNVTTWGNQYLDNLFNLYVDSPEDIINGTLRDPAALSFIQKGAVYRDSIVSEANPIAVLRSKAVNIRDYTGALMFDEARTRLYYTVRVLQDYILDGFIKKERLDTLPKELQQIFHANTKELIDAYNNTSYTIVQEVINLGFNENYILDILKWIDLGHYKLSESDITRLIYFYNINVLENKKIKNISLINNETKMQIVRMTEHLTHIKKKALI